MAMDMDTVTSTVTLMVMGTVMDLDTIQQKIAQGRFLTLCLKNVSKVL